MVSKRGEKVLVGVLLSPILLASIMYSMLLASQLTSINSSTAQVNQFEKLEYVEVYCDKVDGSWVVSLELGNRGETNIGCWIEKILVNNQYVKQRLDAFEKIYVKDHCVKDQVFDVTYIDNTGNILEIGDLNTNNEINPEVSNVRGIPYDFIIPEGMLWFVQFKVPEEAVPEDYIYIQIDSGGGMEYINRIDLSEISSVDLYEISERLPIISERLYNENIQRQQATLRRRLIEKMLQWMPIYLPSCIYFGVLHFLYRPRFEKLGNHGFNGYFNQRFSQIVFDGYSRFRFMRENGYI